MKTFLKEFGYLRAIAALSVIMIHVTGRFDTGQTSHIVNQTMRYAVPLFIIMSGFLLYYSDTEKKETSVLKPLYKRVKKVLIPYVLWTLIYDIYNYRHNLSMILQGNSHTLKFICKQLIYGTGSYHMYFVVIIIQMYVLYPLLKIWMERSKNTVLVISFIMTLGFQTAIYLKELGFNALLQSNIPYYEIFPVWIFYFVFGIYCASCFDRWKDWTVQNMPGIISIWFLSLAIVLTDAFLSKIYDISMKPSIIIYCVASFYFLYIICTRIQLKTKIIAKFLDWVSKQSFIIYLSHALILDGIVLLSDKYNLAAVWNKPLSFLLLFFIETASTLLIVYLLDFIPGVKLLGGTGGRSFRGTRGKIVID